MVTPSTAPYPPDMAMPVQMGFKHRLPDGRVLDLLLRRVKSGNETAIELSYDGPNHVSGYGRFSDAKTLMERLRDVALADAEMGWATQVVETLLAQAGEVCRYQPALWNLFCPKGKLEFYAPVARPFTAQYIASNFTLKWHAAELAEQPHLLLHGLAQHLDYPFGPGERRFSTSRLFDLCFTTEKAIAPKSLAARIDNALEDKGLWQTARQQQGELEHIGNMLTQQSSAAIRTSYERVLQRERFAALITHWYGKQTPGIDDPILQHFRQFIELDLMHHQQNDFKNYPQKTRDELADAMHFPLALIFSAGTHDTATG